MKGEIKEKLERRVTVGGFLGNTNKEEREKKTKEFLDSLGTMSNYGEYNVFAKGATGSEAIVQFASRTVASQFIKDNIEAIKNFKVLGKSGEPRNTHFSRYLDQDQWKVYHATRLLAVKLSDSGQMAPMPVKAFKHRGMVSIDGFDIIKLKVGMDGNMEYKLIKQNIQNIGVENLEARLRPVIGDFAATFH